MDKLKLTDNKESKLRLSADRKVSPLSIFSESEQEWRVKVKNAFGLPAGDSCPGATEWCFSETGGKCYANKIQKYRPNVDKLVWYNFELLKAAGSAKKMTALLVEMIGSIKWYGTDRIFRWFWDGDLFSRSLTTAIRNTCLAFPEIQFYLYTRSFQFVYLLTDTPNLVVYLSVDCYNVGKAKKTKKNHPWTKLAFSADTWDETEQLATMFQEKAVRCPELTGALPLVTDEGEGACISCQMCVYGIQNVSFASNLKLRKVANVKHRFKDRITILVEGR